MLVTAPLRPAAAQQLTGLEPGILIIQALTQIAVSGGPQAIAARNALGQILTGPAAAQVAAAIAQGLAPNILTTALRLAKQAGKGQQGGDNQQENANKGRDDNKQGDDHQGGNNHQNQNE